MTDFAGMQALCRRLAISESGFVFDPVSGQSFTVNETGLAVLRRFQQSTDIAEIQQSLAGIYDIQLHELERDINDFSSDLTEIMR